LIIDISVLSNIPADPEAYYKELVNLERVNDALFNQIAKFFRSTIVSEAVVIGQLNFLKGLQRFGGAARSVEYYLFCGLLTSF